MVGAVIEWFADPANWQGESGLLNRLLEHSLLTVAATLLAVLVGLPVALWLGHVGRGGVLAVNISNVGRAVPTFAVLLLLSLGPLGTAYFGPFGRAGLATLVALVLFGLPPILTNAYVGMREVDQDTVEAARGMGMTGPQVVWRVELPLAAPLILAGLRLAVVQIWATATIAALVAGPGLGRIITLGFTRQDVPQVVAGSLVVAVIALGLELVLVVAQAVVDPVARARRTLGAVPPAGPPAVPPAGPPAGPSAGPSDGDAAGTVTTQGAS